MILLKEILVTDREIQTKSNEFENLFKQINILKSKIKDFNKKYNNVAKELIVLLEQVYSNIYESKKLTVIIHKKEFEKIPYKYKEAIDWLYNSVNGAMRKLVDEILSLYKIISKISVEPKIQKKEVFDNLWTELRVIINKTIKKVKIYNITISQVNEEFSKSIKKVKG